MALIPALVLTAQQRFQAGTADRSECRVLRVRLNGINEYVHQICSGTPLLPKPHFKPHLNFSGALTLRCSGSEGAFCRKLHRLHRFFYEYLVNRCRRLPTSSQLFNSEQLWGSVVFVVNLELSRSNPLPRNGLQQLHLLCSLVCGFQTPATAASSASGS